MQNLSASIVETTRARDKILFTAHDMFYRDGIRATGIDRLIAQSNVTKTTFYRHFPSKKNLIIEFLELRHKNWIDWFRTRLAHHGSRASSITRSIEEWLINDNFRGCAFLNSVGELGAEIPEVLAITQGHKREVVDTINSIVGNHKNARAIAVAIDGAILKAQFDQNTEIAVEALDTLINSLTK